LLLEENLEKGPACRRAKGNIKESTHLDDLKIAPQFYEDQTDALLAGRGDNEQPK